MPRYVTVGDLWFDTCNAVEAGMIRKMLRTGDATIPGLADLDRAHRAGDKRLMRAEKRRKVTRG